MKNLDGINVLIEIPFRAHLILVKIEKPQVTLKDYLSSRLTVFLTDSFSIKIMLWLLAA